METPVTQLEELYERGETYATTTIELAKLKGLETTTIVVTALIWRLSVILMFAVFILVLNIGVALWLGQLLGQSYYGFFIVAGFYLLSGLVLHFFFQNPIKRTLTRLIITQALQ